MSAFTVARLGPSWLCQPLMFTAGRSAAMLVLFACMAGPAPAHAPRRTGSLDLKAIVQAVEAEDPEILCSILLLDADMHADQEASLLAEGSQQPDLWGINLYPSIEGEDWIEFDSMISVAQRAAKTATMERGMTVITNLDKQYPGEGVGDVVKKPQWAREFLLARQIPAEWTPGSAGLFSQFQTSWHALGPARRYQYLVRTSTLGVSSCQHLTRIRDHAS